MVRELFNIILFSTLWFSCTIEASDGGYKRVERDKDEHFGNTDPGILRCVLDTLMNPCNIP